MHVLARGEVESLTEDLADQPAPVTQVGFATFFRYQRFDIHPGQLQKDNLVSVIGDLQLTEATRPRLQKCGDPLALSSGDRSLDHTVIEGSEFLRGKLAHHPGLGNQGSQNQRFHQAVLDVELLLLTLLFRAAGHRAPTVAGLFLEVRKKLVFVEPFGVFEATSHHGGECFSAFRHLLIQVADGNEVS